MKKKIILVGVNHAGTSFLKFIRNKYDGGEITAYDQNDNVSFLGCGIAL
jgi:prephenate dehydrogenase